ncbi:uncharacterized protein LOC113359963 [Papaver somniferum]|uniref:uncharacterized protein LOC113359963 n=1 Tax=Papaver somniferum TaxID=3469 RepID=UPI000E6FB2B9|nr:uncharacterized protein LOC113359963 [Papaver somniferum]
MNVTSMTKTAQVMGEVIAIEPEDAIPIGSDPVRVCVNVDMSMPMRRGVKCSTNAGVTKWQQYFFERQPKGICTEYYIINHSKEACKAAANFLKKAHEKPYFFGKMNSIRKIINDVTPITETSSTKAPTVKKNLIGIIIEEESRLGKRHRVGEITTKSSPATETDSQSTMLNPVQTSMDTQLIENGVNPIVQTHKGNQKDGFACNIIDTSHNLFNIVVHADLSKPEFMLICMYGYSNYTSKKDQWNHIQIISNDINNPWVLIGDLNFHLLDCDTSTSTSADGMVTNIFATCGLEDLGYVGKSFTWTNSNIGAGTKHSRIDMALGNVDWNLNFPNSKLYHLNQVGSDHSPIMLVTDAITPSCWKPFKFFLTWLNDPSCKTVIANAWNSYVNGSPAYQLHKIKGEFYQQKSRDDFIKDIENNSKYFHSKVNNRKCRNNIDSIQDHENKWLQTREEISGHLTMHFKNISTSVNPNLDENLYNVLPSIISDEDNLALTRIPSNEEIHSTFKSMENWSAPGPEGFQAGFYKSQWDIVGEDVCLMVKRFFESMHILKQINNTYISLIPKKKKAISAADYRPIGVCNTSYKVISKVIVNRMKPLMEKLISPFQAAYVSGRLISDNTVIAQEIIHSIKKKRGETGWMDLKLDMSKAFDRLEWSFLIKVLQSLVSLRIFVI